jgi:single-stranded DNA-binding protein
LTKGTHLQIVGEIQTCDYVAKDGAKKSVTEIRVHRIARLDRASRAKSTGGTAA